MQRWVPVYYSHQNNSSAKIPGISTPPPEDTVSISWRKEPKPSRTWLHVSQVKLGCKSTSAFKECADFLGSQISQLDAVPSRMLCSGSGCPSSTSDCFWSSISHLGLSSESFRLLRVCSAEAQRTSSVQRLLHPHKLAQRQRFCALEYRSSETNSEE